VEGVRVAKVWSAMLKVTTALATGAGVALSRVAVTVTGVPAESVLAKGVMVRVGVPAVPPVPPTASVARFVA
jgi:sarcosine oxidase gamma subunit